MRRTITATAILLCLWGNFLCAQRMTPVVRQVDHVLVECRDPQKIYSFFADTLQLPIAWPMNQNQNYASGGIGTGDVNIELFSYVGKASTATTHFYGIAFEPYPLSDALHRLQFLSIRYDKPVPVTASLPNGSTGIAWTTVALPTLSKPAMSIFLYEYSPSFLKVDVRRKQMGNRLMLNRGGPLGINGVDEIVIGSTDLKKDLAAWKLMFGNLSSAGRISPINGPPIRIAADTVDQVREITFRVESLAKARNFLVKSKLLGSASGSKLYIIPSKLQGLRIAVTGK